MNEEYLPPENAMTVTDNSVLKRHTEFSRIQCSLCSNEVGHDGPIEDAWILLERMGWKVGRTIICPACVEKTARKFFKRYGPSTD